MTQPPTVRSIFAQRPLLPIVTIASRDDALRVADLFLEAGIMCIEITLRTASALDAVAELSSRADIVVGVGTVKSPQQFEAAVSAGASFIVTPANFQGLAGIAIAMGVPTIPGASSTTEIAELSRSGFDTIKVFPINLLGGPEFLKAIEPIFPELRFVPSGGVSFESVAEYLRRESVLSCGASWIAPPSLVIDGAWSEIGKRAKSAVEMVQT